MPFQELLKPKQKPNHRWNYTILAEQAYGETYGGRNLIGRDEDVRGGVYYGTYKGEAIVVDPEKYPDEYDRYYDIAAEKATVDGKISRSEVLRAVFDTVKSEMDYSQDGVDGILQRVADQDGLPRFRNGDKLELSMFMKEGVGVCRHQALVCAALLERFKDEGHIRGDISVDRNERAKTEDERAGGHAWVRYTSSDGHIMILDVAQKYFGLLKDTNPRDHWDYMRPEEQRQAGALGRLSLTDAMRL